jgi:uncharacterized protein (DUF1499 family)
VISFGYDIDAMLDVKNRLINIRFASRIGYGDSGVNRKRIEILHSQLQQAQIV